MKESELLLSESEIETLSKDEKLEYLSLLEAREAAVDAHEAANDLAVFARGAWQVLEPSTDLKWNWHLDLICEYLALLREHKIKRLIVNVPPQTMKSRLCTVMFPVWCWTKDPTRRFLASSYSEGLSTDHSLERRMLVQSSWFQSLWPNKVRLASDLNRVTEFKNTRGGRMFATSTAGTATGKGVHGIVEDDPQNPQQAESEAERKAANDFHDGTLSTRFSDRDAFWHLIIQQRLHVDDLTAHVQTKMPGEWTLISLPMVAEQDEEWKFPISERVVTRKREELLWPERFNAQSVKEISVELGPYRFAGQLQQRPTPPGGMIIQRAWFQFWNDGNKPPKFEEVLLSFDMNFGDTKSKTPSFVVGQAWGRVGARKYLLWEIRGLWSFEKSIPQVLGLVGRHPEAGYKLVEKKANGAAILSSLEEVVSGLMPIEPDGSKEARMYAASPDYAAGNVFVPDPSMPGYEWVHQHIEEVCHHPQEPNDRGDCSSQAINFFRKNQSGFINWLKRDADKREAEKKALAEIPKHGLTVLAR
jgi:predicted phage terminase large subunit-like protein